MAKFKTLTEEEKAAFYAAVIDVIPLKSSNKIVLSSKQSVIKKPPRQLTPVLSSEFFIPSHPPPPIISGISKLSYKQTGVTNKILRNLGKGQYTVDARLDLHGMTVEEAMSAVTGFLRNCHNNNNKLALIIHGKGLHSKVPILKNSLNHWLRHFPDVLAFCSAEQRHGGLGAIYVLLKCNKEEILV